MKNRAITVKSLYLRARSFFRAALDRSPLRKRAADPWAYSKDRERYGELREKYTVEFRIDGRRCPRRNICLVTDDTPTIPDFSRACAELRLPFNHLDPRTDDFFERLAAGRFDGCIVRPSVHSRVIRELYDEKVRVMEKDMGYSLWPNSTELRLYEAKRRLAYFLKAHTIPHPATRVFYQAGEALDFAKTARYPLVMKTHLGSAASGVRLIRTPAQARDYITVFFDGTFTRDSADPRDTDWGYVFLQEYVRDAREYRVIKIGASWFGHEKLKSGDGDFHSGSGANAWTPPPYDLLNFCDTLAAKHGFNCMCFDVFQDRSGAYLVNELQTWFGSYNPSQMYLDGVPGRYVKRKAKWTFEPGLFNNNGGANLRLVEFIRHLNAGNK